MNEELTTLWKLNELDAQLVAEHGAMVGFPAQRSAIEARIRSERTHLDALKTRVADAQKIRRDRERDIEGLRDQERKFQSQLPAIKKNEEYTALLHEIEAVKSKRSDIETEVLILMEDEERLQGERPRIEAELARVEREAQERGTEIDREEAIHRGRADAIEAQRAGLVTQLSATLRARYERVRASKDGRAVVPIIKGACGGCYRGQPPQLLQEAKRGDRILVCDGCGRMMIWPPETG